MRRPLPHLALTVLGIALLAGCTGSTSGDKVADDSGTSDTDTSDSGGSTPVDCPTPTAGPTIHDSVIEADEVWRADEGPHLVEQWITVREGATLTIEPCATVEIAEGKGFSVAYPPSPGTGSLVAE